MARKDGKEMKIGTLWQVTLNLDLDLNTNSNKSLRQVTLNINLATLDSHALKALNFNLDQD